MKHLLTILLLSYPMTSMAADANVQASVQTRDVTQYVLAGGDIQDRAQLDQWMFQTRLACRRLARGLKPAVALTSGQGRVVADTCGTTHSCVCNDIGEQ